MEGTSTAKYAVWQAGMVSVMVTPSFKAGSPAAFVAKMNCICQLITSGGGTPKAAPARSSRTSSVQAPAGVSPFSGWSGSSGR